MQQLPTQISLLSIFNKVFDKVIHNDISDFIEKNNILFLQQFGFRKYHSTIDALINVHDFIIDRIREKNKVIGIFLDFKKAFDTIDPIILIKKLDVYGISGPYNELINSYLTDRKTVTNIGSAFSLIEIPFDLASPSWCIRSPSF